MNEYEADGYIRLQSTFSTPGRPGRYGCHCAAVTEFCFIMYKADDPGNYSGYVIIISLYSIFRPY